MKDDIKVFFAAVRADFKVFLQYAFSMLYPGKTFLDNWHIDAIIYCLLETLHGRRKRQIFNLPPRHLKSFIVSVAWPAFLWGINPSTKFICVSYSDELARALSRDFKRLVESEGYRRIFPHVRLTKATEGELVTDQGGFRLATSIGGTLTGRGADYIIIDDPIKPEDATSDKARQAVNEWYRSTLLSRLDDKAFSVLILLMQRLGVNDLTGFVESEGGFAHLSLPAIALKDEVIAVGPDAFLHRRAGEALHAERESLEILRGIRDSVGPRIFNAQYQQAPDAPDGQLFKRSYFKTIDRAPAWTTGSLWVSIDSALSTSNNADYSAISLALAQDGLLQVCKTERGRWDFDELRRKAWHYVERYARGGRHINFVIENAGSGISLRMHLTDMISRGDGLFTCFGYQPRLDKVARAALVLPDFSQGRVVFVNAPGRNAWVEPCINEFLCFPNGRFDDQVDSVVQLLLTTRVRIEAGFYG
jgi:predicted phage terminase large subunit-like protein